MRYLQSLGIGLLSCFFCWNTGFAQSGSHSEDPRIEELIALKAEMVKKNELEQRYVVQLGSYSSIKDAQSALEDFKSEYEDIYGRLQYESPNYKVWVGSFTSRLAAERLFVLLKKEFKSAFVFKPR